MIHGIRWLRRQQEKEGHMQLWMTQFQHSGLLGRHGGFGKPRRCGTFWAKSIWSLGAKHVCFRSSFNCYWCRLHRCFWALSLDAVICWYGTWVMEIDKASAMTMNILSRVLFMVTLGGSLKAGRRTVWDPASKLCCFEVCVAGTSWVIDVQTFRRPWGDFNASLQRPSTKVSWVYWAWLCYSLKTYQDVKIIRWTFVVQNIRSLGGNHVVGGFVLRRHRLMGTFLMLG